MKINNYKKNKRFLVLSLERVIVFSLLFLVISCGAESSEISMVSEEEQSLNGDWKFNTIYGEGYNYLNVEEHTSDIVIDNADKAKVKIKGKWKIKKVARRGTAFYKKNYLARNFKNGESAENFVRFYPKIKKTGYYEAFVRHPFSSHLTAQCNVNHAGGKTKKYVSQRTYCGEWISIGIYKFHSKDDSYVEFTAITEGQVAADAVLFRPILEEKYLEAKKLPSQVYLSGFNDANWHDLKVPGHWGMINTYSNYTGIGWYRKTFDLPSNWSLKDDEKIRIQFGAVYHLAEVYVNGKFVGKHQGGFTPFEFDITDKVQLGKKNVIAVKVDNSFVVGATWNWGGIIRDVAIKKDKNVRIQNQYIHVEPDLEKGTAEVTLRVKLENNSNKAKKINVVSRIKEIAGFSLVDKAIEVAPNSIKTVVLKGVLDTEDVVLWHFDNPYLYTLQTTISDAVANLDSEVDAFGIRKIELTNSQLLLNGEPIRTGGFNRVSENRYFGSSEPLEILERDVDLMKASGANFMRIMHGTQNEKLIELCDKKGILLFEEVNVRDLTNPEFTAPEYPLVKSWIKGMVERDCNHPSIIGWSVGNELSHHYDYAKMMMDYVRTELDEFRLVTCVSNSGQKPQYTPETDPNTHVDMIMHNMYRWQGKPQEILNTLREKWPNKPIFISEYGFDPYPTASLDGDKPIVSEWNQHFRGKNEFVIGSSMWTFNDYRSGYAGTSAEENRVWGVVNVWGQKRRLFNRFQKENSPIKTLTVGAIDLSKKTTSVSIVSKGAKGYPSYTLKGYKLVYTFYDESGKVFSRGTTELPVVKPGTQWEGVITWEDVKEPYRLNAQVINPLGYERGKKEIFFKVPNPPVVSEVIAGETKARVFFKKGQGVKEYMAVYHVAGGEVQYTKPTISNFIDLDSLTSHKKYNVSLIAVNGKGKSLPSKEVIVKLGTKKLPPIVWESFVDHQKLVIGYSSEFEDEEYTVLYGTDKNNLSNVFTSNVRGMMTIDLGKSVQTPLYFKIRTIVNGESSNWSPIIKVK